MSKNKTAFLGVAWTYANYFLHVGHLCAYMPADILARYYRKAGVNTCMVSGTDCHGTPITKRAKDEGKHPEQNASFYHNSFEKTFKDIDFTYDLYTATMEDYHKTEVQKLLVKMKENGYIYKREGKAAFCATCNKFIEDRELVLTCAKCGKKSYSDGCDCGHIPTEKEIEQNAVCAACDSKPEFRQASNYVLAFSKLLPKLEDYIKTYSKNWRPNAVGITLDTINFLKEQGQKADKVIDREIDWGVPMPEGFQGAENKKVYVWFEAVLGYYTACKRWCEENGKNINDFFSDTNCQSYYFHGKDNVFFHSVLFPCILMACGLTNLPHYIVSVEHLNMNNEKVSKSTGNLISVKQATDIVGSDSVRYFLVAKGPEKKDTNFSLEELIQVHNTEIVNKYGNFINRTLKFKGLTTMPMGQRDAEVSQEIKETYEQIAQSLEQVEFRKASERAMKLVEFANKYYEDNKPWEKAKLEDLTAFNNIMFNCTELCANIANIMQVWVPKSANKIAEYLQIDLSNWEYIKIENQIDLPEIEPLFERIKQN